LREYIKLKQKDDTFGLIAQQNLFDAIQDKVANLMELDTQRALQLLIENTDRIPISRVVSQLSDKRQWLHEYLHALFKKDVHMANEFHEKQVELYAQYDYKLLLPFLKQSNYYPLEKALTICEQKSLYPEMVFILGRMGNNKQALHLIIDKIKDIKQAIEFAKQQNDVDLWEDLIANSINNAEFISGLLENIGTHVDPIKLIQKIPNSMKIPGLRDKLVKILSDFNLQISLQEGCKEVLRADCVYLAGKLSKGQKAALRIDDTAQCSTCDSSALSFKEIVIFFCGHVYHEQCLVSAYPVGTSPIIHKERVKEKEKDKDTASPQLFCPICYNAQQKKGQNSKMDNSK